MDIRILKLKFPFFNNLNFIRQRQLKFHPPMEEIRMKYFSQLKKFISVPIGFHGIADSSDSIFVSIVDQYVKIITRYLSDLIIFMLFSIVMLPNLQSYS